MGTTSKVCSVILRVWELCCAAIVAGLVGRYMHLVYEANANPGSRIIYTIVIASISLFLSLVFMPPFKFTFYCFLIDFILWICWMVSFGLLQGLTGGAGCRSYWYWNTWGYYWGGWYHMVPVVLPSQSLVGTTACAQWRAAVSFVFIGGWGWFFSGVLGIYVCTKIPDEQVAVKKMNTVQRASTSVGHWYHKKSRKGVEPVANGGQANGFEETRKPETETV